MGPVKHLFVIRCFISVWASSRNDF